jgi:hypothetical protein
MLDEIIRPVEFERGEDHLQAIADLVTDCGGNQHKDRECLFCHSMNGVGNEPGEKRKCRERHHNRNLPAQPLPAREFKQPLAQPVIFTHQRAHVVMYAVAGLS